MRVLIILAAVCFSANAMAQAPPPPKGGHKPFVQVKPKAQEGCKLVGTVKGTKRLDAVQDRCRLVDLGLKAKGK